MVFCIINELKTCGGAEQSVKKMRQILTAHGHDVYVIYMKVYNHESLDQNEYVLNPKLGIIDKFFYNYFLKIKLEGFLFDINPDVVLLNNVFSAPVTVFKALRGYKVYQFVRDYWPVCPKSTCISDSGNICKGFLFANCFKECRTEKGYLYIALKLWLLKRVNILRKDIVEKCFPPGKLLSDYMSNFGYKSIAINNPNQYEACPERVIDNKLHRYIYIGVMTDNKGIYEMLQAFEILSEIKDKVELHMYGRIVTSEDENKIAAFTGRCKRIIYHGFITHDKIQQILRESYALIVPSKWLEAFGNTVMEGMANRLLVLGTNRGGILEQLSDGRGILFDISIHSIYEALLKAEKLSEADYMEITDRAYEYVLANNSYEMYYSQLMSEICGERRSLGEICF